jgi:hypothetical protein
MISTSEVPLRATVSTPEIPVRMAVPTTRLDMHDWCRRARRWCRCNDDGRWRAYWRWRNHDFARRIVNHARCDHDRRWNRQGWRPHADFRQEWQLDVKPGAREDTGL